MAEGICNVLAPEGRDAGIGYLLDRIAAVGLGPLSFVLLAAGQRRSDSARN
jgi:hypothetical protein